VKAQLRVSLIQGATRWHDAAANRDYYAHLLAPLKDQTDLALLPETFTSGFTNDTLHQAETMDGASVAWLRAQAQTLGAFVGGSLVIRIGEKCVNRFVLAAPDGGLGLYDKRHLFRMANEHERYVAGEQSVIVDVHGWRVNLSVCYDLRFPVWLRNRNHYDLLVCVANWPAARRTAWQTLLRARAIENLSFVAAVNRVGTDGNGLSYAGDSVALDPLGAPLVELGALEQVVTTTLDAAQLHAHRERFPAHLDADGFELTKLA
jgi:omega-amidase